MHLPLFLLLFCAVWSACAAATVPAVGFVAPAPVITFTPQEQAFIASSDPITMCVDPDWVPFERINAQGEHEGIGADLVQLVAQRVGLRLQLLQLKTWDDMLAASKANRCQIMSFLNRSPVRDQWLIFTEPVFYDPNIIVTREEHAFVADLRGLEGARVALPRGTSIEERVRRDFPNLNIVLTDNEQDAIAMVSERKADMTIRSLIVAAYTIRKEGLFNLKIAGQIPEYTNQLRIGVLKGERVLRDILDKGVRTITAQEREAISNRHVAISVQSRVDYKLLAQVITLGAILLLAIVLWNRKLAQFNRRLTTLNQELERISVTDKLTGLFNRVKLDQVLSTELARAQRSGACCSVLLLDIDHFKQVNDTHGHQAGDQVLQRIARILETGTRKTDIAGRWGGEEFLLVCPDTDIEGARRLGETLRLAVAQQVFPGVGSKTLSVGVANFRPGDEVKDVVARADAALYAAKHAGRNRVEVAASDAGPIAAP
jgi:diguanylate cyclase (GGDEF)-like protein